MKLIWLPTYRCNLRCSYCVARSIPRIHAGELKPQNWIDFFNSAPVPIEAVAISGGEPTVYSGLKQVIADTSFSFTIDTNCRIPPATYINESTIDRLISLNISLHFHPDHDLAKWYWETLSWFQNTFPGLKKVQTTVVATQRELPSEIEVYKERTAAYECVKDIVVSTFDDTFLFNRITPPRKADRFSPDCDAGTEYATLMADGTAYRCLGHAYYDMKPLGNIVTDGWKIRKPDIQPCYDVICTACDLGSKTIYSIAQGEKL